MLRVFAFCLLAALAAAAPQNNVPDGELDQILRNIASMGFPVPGPETTVLRYEYSPPSPFDYTLYYVLSDGTQVGESGTLREDGVFAKKGFFSFLTGNDNQHTVRYNADENGFNPEVEEEPPGSVDPGFAAAAIG